MFQGDECLSLGHLLRTWPPDMRSKTYLAVFPQSETSVCTYSVPQGILGANLGPLKIWLYFILGFHSRVTKWLDRVLDGRSVIQIFCFILFYFIFIMSGALSCDSRSKTSISTLCRPYCVSLIDLWPPAFAWWFPK